MLRTLFKYVHQLDNKGTSQIRNLAREVNSDLWDAGERFQVSSREAGAALTSLGFTKRKRTNSGYEVLMTLHEIKKIHHLIAAYGLDRCVGLISDAARRRCDFCSDSGIPAESPVATRKSGT